MRVTVISVGKNNDTYTSIIGEFVARVERTTKLEWLHLVPSGKPEQQARKQETADIITRVKPNAVVWLLDERGEQLTSTLLAQKFEVMRYQGMQDWVIIIGGAYGVDDTLRKRADFVWSLSQLVFPHRLAQLIVAEQLYRATEIIRGSGYHHA